MTLTKAQLAARRQPKKGKRYTEEDKAAVVREFDAGKTVAMISRETGIPEKTIWRWLERESA